MKAMKLKFKELALEEDGATAVEYGVLVALIIAACVVVIGAIGQQIKDAFEKINTELNSSKPG